jgi:2-oxoglutarate ferredoxin oxidoreductase subunit beta
MTNTNLSTSAKNTWCPGCYNFQILAAMKRVLEEEIKNGRKKDEFAIVTGIGCHGKIFDYLNLNGINSLHGRVLPTCLGLKIGNPNLEVLGFSGDGDAYSEGMEHLIHHARYNSNIKYFVHNNQVFALTVGQPTSVTEIGFKDKTTPMGVKLQPINPIKIMLAAGASFVARVFADINQIDYVFKEALKHKGFTFVEILQPCLIFHPSTDYKKRMYSLEKEGHDKTNFEAAMRKAEEFDYDKAEKIPLGIFYQTKKPVFEEQIEQLRNLKEKKKNWKDIKR